MKREGQGVARTNGARLLIGLGRPNPLTATVSDPHNSLVGRQNPAPSLVNSRLHHKIVPRIARLDICSL